MQLQWQHRILFVWLLGKGKGKCREAVTEDMVNIRKAQGTGGCTHIGPIQDPYRTHTGLAWQEPDGGRIGTDKGRRRTLGLVLPRGCPPAHISTCTQTNPSFVLQFEVDKLAPPLLPSRNSNCCYIFSTITSLH